MGSEMCIRDRSTIVRLLATLRDSACPGALVLFALDTASCHLDRAVLQQMFAADIFPLIIPKNTTWLLQPLDVFVFVRWKAHLRRLYHNAIVAGMTPGDVAAFLSILYEAILSSLQVQGFQAVEDGAVTRIIPFTQAFQFAGGDGDNRLVTEIVKVRHVQAATLVPIIKPLLSNGARVLAFAGSNYLVMSDIRSNITAANRVIKQMDDPDQTAVEVINLDFISAGEAVHIAGQLKQLQKQELSLVEDGLNNRVIVSGLSLIHI